MIGIVTSAISGSMVAIEKRTDVFGVAFLGIITALGGGVIRDVLIGRLPPVMFSSYEYVLTAALVSLLVFFLAFFTREKYQKNDGLIKSINNIFDAIGLGAFAVIGARTAVDAGFGDNMFLVVCLGMITGIGGGLLRDIMIREIPFILKKRIYALAALAGALTYALLVEVSDSWALIAGIFVTFLLRILATVFKWDLPTAY